MCGLFAKSREHSAPTTMLNRTGRAKFWHEVQFVYDGKVVCVWKLEATGVTHGAGHQENLRAAVSEFTHLFAAIARTGKADDDGA